MQPGCILRITEGVPEFPPRNLMLKVDSNHTLSIQVIVRILVNSITIIRTDE